MGLHALDYTTAYRATYYMIDSIIHRAISYLIIITQNLVMSIL
jgi:hypothetical protein